MNGQKTEFHAEKSLRMNRREKNYRTFGISRITNIQFIRQKKNLDLLKLIVQTSSNPESLVMDFFCGSGTTLIAAQELGRNWIGIDKSEKAIEVTRKKITKENSSLSKADFESVSLLEKQDQNSHNENILVMQKTPKVLVTA